MSEQDELQIGTPAQEPVTAAATPEEVAQAVLDNKQVRCGFCGMDPLRIHIDDVKQDIGSGAIVVRTVACAGCRVALSVVVLGKIAQPRPQTDLSVADQAEWLRLQKEKFGN